MTTRYTAFVPLAIAACGPASAAGMAWSARSNVGLGDPCRAERERAAHFAWGLLAAPCAAVVSAATAAVAFCILFFAADSYVEVCDSGEGGLLGRPPR